MKCQRVFCAVFVVCLGSCFTADLVLASGADLLLTSIKGPTKAFLNQTISVTHAVRNQGDGDSGSYQVGLYLSKNTTVDPANDRLLKEITFPAGLAAGQTDTDHWRSRAYPGGLNGLYHGGWRSSIALLTSITPF